MQRPWTRWWFRYGLALSLTVLMAVVRSYHIEVTGPRQHFALFYFVVIFAAWQGGFGPSLLAVGLSALLVPFLFMEPYRTFLGKNPLDWLAVGTFMTLSGVVIAFSEWGSQTREKLEGEVGERRRAERQEREQRERLSATLSSVGDGVIVTDAGGTVVMLNPVAELMTGWQEDEAKGRGLREVFRTIDADTKASAEMPTAARLAAGDSGTPREVDLSRRGGDSLSIEQTTSPIQDGRGRISGVVIVFRDVTERRRSAKVLRESEQRLVQLADTMPQIVWTAGPDGSVDYFNARWYEYTGFSSTETLADEGWARTVHPEDLPTLARVRDRAVGAGTLFEAEVRIRDGAGEYRWHLVRSIPVKDDEGRLSRRFGTATDIDDRKRAEERLRSSEQRFRLLAEAMPQIVWVNDSDGKLDYLNQRWFDYTGSSRASLNVEDITQRTIHPDDIPKVRAEDARAWATREAFEAEYRLRDRTGTYRWHLGRSVVVEDDEGSVICRLGTATDIDDRRRTEDGANFLARVSASLALLEDEETALQQVAGLAVPTFADWCEVDLIDDEGGEPRSIVGRDESGRSPDEPGFRRVSGVGGNDLGPDRVIRTGESEMLSTIPDDGGTFGVFREMGIGSYLCVPLKGVRGVMGAITFLAEQGGRTYGVGELRLAEDLGRRVAIAVENSRLYGRLLEADRRKDEFLATLAHELRNPLAPIRNALHLMKGMDASSAQEMEAERAMAERQVTHLARLVDDLMDVSRISRGKIELRRETVDLSAVAKRALGAVRSTLRERGHSMEVVLPEGPVPLLADPTRLEQVLWNLLINAIKYTEPGGNLRLEVARDGTEATVRVADTGVGITAEMLPKVFDMFVQVGENLERAQGGLGIGLSLVKTLVEMHGGRISATSPGPGLGSEFVVTLPMATPASDPSASWITAKSGTEAAREKETPALKKVLVVDDNEDAANSLARLLRRLYRREVQVVHDGPGALAAAAEFGPELVLLDIGMPGMSGYEVARQLRAQGFAKTRLVALTGWGQEADRVRSAEAGFDEHLVKPIDPDELRRLLG